MEAGRIKPPFEPDPHAVYAKVGYDQPAAVAGQETSSILIRLCPHITPTTGLAWPHLIIPSSIVAAAVVEIICVLMILMWTVVRMFLISSSSLQSKESA